MAYLPFKIVENQRKDVKDGMDYSKAIVRLTP